MVALHDNEPALVDELLQAMHNGPVRGAESFEIQVIDNVTVEDDVGVVPKGMTGETFENQLMLAVPCPEM